MSGIYNYNECLMDSHLHQPSIVPSSVGAPVAATPRSFRVPRPPPRKGHSCRLRALRADPMPPFRPLRTGAAKVYVFWVVLAIMIHYG